MTDCELTAYSPFIRPPEAVLYSLIRKSFANSSEKNEQNFKPEMTFSA